MAKIISIPIQFEIFFPDEYIIYSDDEYVSFEIPLFDWQYHAAYKCKDCNAFLKSFGTTSYKWLIQIHEEYYLIDVSSFGKEDDYFKNLSLHRTSSQFTGTKLKLKIKKADPILLDTYQILHEAEERYEMCNELKNIKDLLKKS